VVTVAFQRPKPGRIGCNDLQGIENYYGARTYDQPKRADALFTHELARRLRQHRGGFVS
jgi:hypothetical protein